MKRMIKAAAAAVLLFSAGCRKQEGPAVPETPDVQEKSAEKDDIYIFYTSDVHCGVSDNIGFSALKALVNDTKAEHENVLLVDAGDYLQGGTLGTLSHGSIIIDLMNQMEYDIVTFGNHEFDYGIERTAELMTKAEFDFIACNARYTGSGENIFSDVPPYVIRDLGGTKVAFIGIMTPQTATSSTPVYFMEDGEFVYDFYAGNDGEDLAEQVQSTVNAARAEGAEYVIAVAHLGSDVYEAPYDSISMIRRTTGIDAVIDGHSHSVIIGDSYPNADGEDVLLTSVGTKLENIGEMIISPDGTISSLLISEYAGSDAEMEASVEAANKELDDILSQPVGSCAFDLNTDDSEGIRMVRSRETNLGDFAADAFRSVMGTDVSFINGGGLRKTISAGTITYGNLLDVFPFEDPVSSCYCTGQQILDALEFGAQRAEALYSFDGNPVGEFGGFLHVSGLKYTIDTTVPSGVLYDENQMMTGIEGERRVKDVMILQDGAYKPIDPKAEYTAASIEYILFEGGGGNTVFQNCTPIVESGPMDIELLIQYIGSLEEIPENYAEPEGRITVH